MAGAKSTPRVRLGVLLDTASIEIDTTTHDNYYFYVTTARLVVCKSDNAPKQTLVMEGGSVEFFEGKWPDSHIDTYFVQVLTAYDKGRGKTARWTATFDQLYKMVNDPKFEGVLTEEVMNTYTTSITFNYDDDEDDE